MSAALQTFELSVPAILAAAELETGLYGLADAGLQQRLGRLLDWINTRGTYSVDQNAAMRRQIQHLLVTRLRLAGDRSQYSSIADERIEKPIFVIGFPRTGTTLLHSLLAEDPAVLAPRCWHSHEPSPPPGAGPVAAQRRARAGRELDRFLDRAPGLLQLHPYWDKHVEALIEDEELFTLDFRNAYPSLLYDVPTLSVMVTIDDGDARGAFRFHRELLQHLQWNSGRRRWALKGVGHQFLLETLFEIYPDALCLWPHRDPVEIQVSTLTIAAVLYDELTGGGMDWKQYAHAWVEGIRTGLDRVLASPICNDPRVMHLDFRQLTADPIGVVRRAYAHGGHEFTPQFEQSMRAWLDDPSNRPDRYGRYRYSYEPFGLREEWVREQFTDYRQRFGLP